ncbi:hypothetical protein ABH905_004443 [Pseudomonas frederiksbergensis]|jgi:hypothetical protein
MKFFFARAVGDVVATGFALTHPGREKPLGLMADVSESGS